MDSADLGVQLHAEFNRAVKAAYYQNAWALFSDGFRLMYCMGGEL